MARDPITSKAHIHSKQPDNPSESRTPEKQFGIGRLVEATRIIIDSNDNTTKLTGLVPFGMNRTDATKLIIEQNSGSCQIEYGQHGELDLSKVRWMPVMVLPSGIVINNPHFAPDEKHLEVYEIDGKRFHYHPDMDFEDGKNKEILIEDGTRLTKDPISLRKGGGGCNGSMSQEEVDIFVHLAELLARGLVKKEVYLLNRETNELSKKEISQPSFEYSPSMPFGLDYRFEINWNARNLTEINDMLVNMFDAPLPEDLNYALRKMMEVEQKTQTNYRSNSDDFDAGSSPKFGSVQIYAQKMVSDSTYTSNDHPPGSPPGIPQAIPPQIIRLKDTIIKDALPTEMRIEESLIMRLLMNPTERRLWGKLYGLPDEFIEAIELHGGFKQQRQVREHSIDGKIVSSERTTEPKQNSSFRLTEDVRTIKADAKTKQSSYGNDTHGPSGLYFPATKEQREIKIDEPDKEKRIDSELDQEARLLDLMQRLKNQVKPSKSNRKKSKKDKPDVDKPPKFGGGKKIKTKARETETIRERLKTENKKHPPKLKQKTLNINTRIARKTPKKAQELIRRKTIRTTKVKHSQDRTKIKENTENKPKTRNPKEITKRMELRRSKKDERKKHEKLKLGKKEPQKIKQPIRISFSSPFQTTTQSRIAKKRTMNNDFRLSWIIQGIKSRKNFKRNHR
ncbi:MAG: hypothetical protein Q7S22_01795 [Candidatus Micrarchaeota archaeon]|nr:hypothetical protein [Candidatus Micrarchaeota archaeon]